MKLNKWLATWLVLLWGWAGREASAQPLDLVPEEADFVITVARPKELVARGWDFVHSEFVRRLPGYEEALDQLTIRRLVQLVRYAERELGKPWRELVDELLGGGVVLAGKYGPVPSPVL
ncbi:MAG: hypothetical protein NZM42_09210, partial [Gemmatales bacterium]|nr:hypothetical protein [Gemmatales bacterium]